MEKLLEKIDKKLWDSAIHSVYNDVKISRQIKNRGIRSVSVYGLNTTLLTKFAVDLSFKLDKMGVRVFTQSVSDSKNFDVRDCLLMGLAWNHKEEFYKRNGKKNYIIVKGDATNQRTKFMNYLREMVDVYVHPNENCCQLDGYVIEFEDLVLD